MGRRKIKDTSKPRKRRPRGRHAQNMDGANRGHAVELLNQLRKHRLAARDETIRKLAEQIAAKATEGRIGVPGVPDEGTIEVVAGGTGTKEETNE